MNSPTLAAPTSPFWLGAVVMLPARMVFALLGQGAAVFLLWGMGHPQPLTRSADFLPLWGSVVDVACLGTLAWLARREGKSLRQLLPSFHWRADLATGLKYSVLMLLVGGAGGTAVGYAIYGHLPPSPMTAMPWWGVLYGVLLWPVLWGLTEQLTYNGYALPRLQPLTGRRLAAGLVVCAWALQHMVMPLRADLTFALYRALSAVPAVLCMVWLYLRSGRLGAMMFAHMLVDAFAVLSVQFAPPGPTGE